MNEHDDEFPDDEPDEVVGAGREGPVARWRPSAPASTPTWPNWHLAPSRARKG